MKSLIIPMVIEFRQEAHDVKRRKKGTEKGKDGGRKVEVQGFEPKFMHMPS